MARLLRIEYAGALYHVTSQGDRQEAIFEDDQDRIAFLNILGEAVSLALPYVLFDGKSLSFNDRNP